MHLLDHIVLCFEATRMIGVQTCEDIDWILIYAFKKYFATPDETFNTINLIKIERK